MESKQLLRRFGKYQGFLFTHEGHEYLPPGLDANLFLTRNLLLTCVFVLEYIAGQLEVGLHCGGSLKVCE